MGLNCDKAYAVNIDRSLSPGSDPQVYQFYERWSRYAPEETPIHQGPPLMPDIAVQIPPRPPLRSLSYVYVNDEANYELEKQPLSTTERRRIIREEMAARARA